MINSKGFMQGVKDYVCKCKKGWDGRYCERGQSNSNRFYKFESIVCVTVDHAAVAPTCRKRKEKLLVEENNCRARKAVSVKNCRGECHDGATCCSVRQHVSFGN